MKTIAIAGTLDTKGKEFEYLRNRIASFGFQTLVINTGAMEEPFFIPDIGAREVAAEAGETLEHLREEHSRGRTNAIMKQGAKKIVQRRDKLTARR